jgi:hypothetical protein
MTLLQVRTRCKAYAEYLTNIPGDTSDTSWDEAIWKGFAKFVQLTHLPFGWKTITDTADASGAIDFAKQGIISVRAVKSSGSVVRRPDGQQAPLTLEQWSFVALTPNGPVAKWTLLDPSRIGVAPAQGTSRTIEILGAYSPLPVFGSRTDGTVIDIPAQVEDVPIVLSVAIMADPYVEGSIMEKMKSINEGAYNLLVQLNERAMGEGSCAFQ